MSTSSLCIPPLRSPRVPVARAEVSDSSYAVGGAGQELIAQALGHADTGATERYTHVQADATAGLVEARWARLIQTKC